MSDDKEIVKVYSSYTPAQKRATQKYRVNNKDKVNEQRKKYYLARKEKDPNFLEYKRMKAKEYYRKKKLSKAEPVVEITPVVEIIPEPVIEPVKEVVEVVEKKKRKASPKKGVSITEIKEELKITEPVKIVEPETLPIVSKKVRKSKK